MGETVHASSVLSQVEAMTLDSRPNGEDRKGSNGEDRKQSGSKEEDIQTTSDMP